MFINHLLATVQFHDDGEVVKTFHDPLDLKAVDHIYGNQDFVLANLV